MKEGTRATATHQRGLAGKSLVVIQVAISIVLVVSAGLFVRTLVNLASVNPGFDAKNLLLIDIAPPESRYPPPADIQVQHRIEQAIAAVPGVEAVTVSGAPLVAGDVEIVDFAITGAPTKEGEDVGSHFNYVGKDFFSTLRIPITEGRGFTETDTETAPRVAVVNKALVKKFFPHENPIGKTFKLREDNKGPIEIVGICADTAYDSLRKAPPETFYVPYRQMDSVGAMTYEIRTRANVAGVLAGVRDAIGGIDKDLPLIDPRTQEEQIRATLQAERIFATLTAGFGVLALILAGVGIYGLMSYNVARRTNEIGVRMALGAQRGMIGRIVIRETLSLVFVGVIIGVPAAWALARLIASQLYGLSPHDPITLAGVTLLLFAAGALAAYIPSRRATRMDPTVALRHE